MQSLVRPSDLKALEAAVAEMNPAPWSVSETHPNEERSLSNTDGLLLYTDGGVAYIDELSAALSALPGDG